jgi:hypothetical protein
MSIMGSSGSEWRAVEESIAWLSSRKFNLAIEGIDLPPPSEYEFFFRRKIHDVVTPVVCEKRLTATNISGLASPHG